ncbi:MAG TPA: PAS-domain containing protein [Acetobacteraceae bacterium]|jgi:signal transduction histidine kinase/DNA-binding NarL/FixJ family response regulator|nr:PAS-domain containing protein [Acetobacteraceae bacterium]
MSRIRAGQAAGLLGIIATTLALILLTWLGTLGATRSQRAEAASHVAANVANQALLFRDQLQRDLLEVDQSLRLLGDGWAIDPKNFRLPAWRNQLVLLNTICSEISISDERGTIRDSTVPETVGANVATRDYFRTLAERVTDNRKMFIGPSILGANGREWHMDLSRPLYHPDGSFAGVIVAALRLGAIGRFYDVANTGTHGSVALVGMGDGKVRLAVGSKPIDPGSSIASTAMFEAMQANNHRVWVGRSALDGIERVHAFQPVSGSDLAVVVAVDRAEAMHATAAWETAAFLFASGITILLSALAVIVIQAIRGARRREELLSHDRAMLTAANSELEIAKARADRKTAQLEATLAGITDGLSMVDGELRLVEWNPRFPEIVGIPASMLRVGLPMEDVLRAQAATGQFGVVDIESEVARRMAHLRAGNVGGTTERERPDGTVIELRRNALPDGGFVTLYVDITARKMAERALRDANALAETANKAMSRFVAVVSHEIRTPLNALLNSLTLLVDRGLAGPEQALLDTARQSGDALMALINDILEMSRMEAGQLSLRRSVFALRSVIESVLEIFATQAADRRLALRQTVAASVPDEIYEDPGRLRQVLINLLSNAVKFAAPGEVRVLAEMQYNAGATCLRLAVRDRGPIISPEGRARLFEPFCRLGESGVVMPIGTGLGLAICRHIATLMGGLTGYQVWMVGEREAGNEFWITVPLKPMPGEPGLVLPRAEAVFHRRLPRTRVLLVEDIVANQVVTATQLRREGHLVDIASNGPEAITAMAAQPYDLVFMDIFMPGMNGLETTQHIRGMGAIAANVPIIALTANVTQEDRAQCAAAGMNDMLGKPISFQDLLDVIGRYVWPYRSDNAPADPTAQAAEPLTSAMLSASRLEELRATLPADTLASLVEDCLVELAERLVLLQQAVQHGDRQPIIAQAHAIAGMAAEYGMASLEMRLRALLHAVIDEPGAIGTIIDELESEMDRTGSAMREALHIEMV